MSLRRIALAPGLASALTLLAAVPGPARADPGSPSVAAVEPSEISALGGTTITVLGTGFRAGTGFAVLVGGSPALDATVLDSRKIVATAPPGAAGPADVTVVAGAGGGLHAYLYRIDPSLSWERIVEEVFRGLAAGKTAAAALREAQLRCLRGELVLEAAGGRPSRKLEHPFYWAPFVLTEG